MSDNVPAIKTTDPQFSFNEMHEILKAMRGVNGSIPAIKYVRTWTHLPLKEAKELVDEVFEMPIIGKDDETIRLHREIENIREVHKAEMKEQKDLLNNQIAYLQRTCEYTEHLEAVIVHILRSEHDGDKS